MFTIKADIIRMAIGLALFTLTSFWLFELTGAVLMLLAGFNFAIHAVAPQVVQSAKSKFEEAHPPICTFDAHGDIIPTAADQALVRRMH